MRRRSKKKANEIVKQSDLIELYRNALNQGMSVSDIEKKINKHVERMVVSDNIELEEDDIRADQEKKRVPRFIRLGALVLPVLFLIVGFYLVGSAVVPILGYYTSSITDIQTGDLTSPIPHEEVMDVTPLVISKPASRQEDTELRIVDEELDYTDLSNWFNSGALPELAGSQAVSNVTEYIIDIPKLDIENAHVNVGGTDLNNSLVAYKGTALPGDPGAPVIFGHSVLRQFYNPSEKNSRRYNSIFSTIMTLKDGDKIYVTVDGVRYTYLVNHKKEVKPEDVYILTQKYDAKQLKLVTCTPEGTYLRRGVVTAQLVE